jgi:hypothetical protein
MIADLRSLLQNHLNDTSCGFSVGGFGALAEFHDAEAEPEQSNGSNFSSSSPRGALRVELSGQERALAYEVRAEHAERWQCGIGIIGDTAASSMSGRTALTELDVDHDAIRTSDRSMRLFDLGAGMPHVDFCVRTDDHTLIEALRRYTGQAVIASGHAALEAIIDSSPHRVVTSRIARIEVYQRIDRHRTPPGPHTHLLPELLRHRRTHSANVPIPKGTAPLLTLHPENPLVDALGRQRDFLSDAFLRFESVLERFGDPAYVAEKQRFRAAIDGNQAPEDYVAASSRIGRLAQRIAFRQLIHSGIDNARLERWRTHFRF